MVECGNANAGAWTYEFTAAHATTGALAACQALDASEPKVATCASLQPNQDYLVTCKATSADGTVTKSKQSTAFKT